MENVVLALVLHVYTVLPGMFLYFYVTMVTLVISILTPSYLIFNLYFITTRIFENLKIVTLSQKYPP